MKKERYNLTEILRGTLSINKKHEACFKTKTMWCPHSCDKSCGAHVRAHVIKFDVDRQTDMTDNYPRVHALELELYIFLEEVCHYKIDKDPRR